MRITKALKALKIACSKNRVARRMKCLNLRAKARRKFKATTDSAHNLPAFTNVLNRDFKAQKINQKWVGDITYIPTKEGFLYLAVVMDLYSRAIIGWSMSASLQKDLVCNALTMALFRRRFPKGVIVHSDRGSQYCSEKYRQILRKNNLIGSMSRKGNCWDNAPSESFFHSLKVELMQQNMFDNRDEAKTQIFNYIEGYYNIKECTQLLTIKHHMKWNVHK
jgi:putative transposase